MVESLLAQAIRKEGPERLASLLTPMQWARARQLWTLWARPDQLEPEGDWRVWLILAGRGWGKSRVGAETVRRWAIEYPGCHIALVGRTAADVRDVMVRALLSSWNGGYIDPKSEGWPHYEPSKRSLVWKNGSRATTYSAEEPDQLRGPQHDFAWADEMAAWSASLTQSSQARKVVAWSPMEEMWHQGLMMGLRGSGECRIPVTRPRCMVTTTPQPKKLIRELLGDPRTHATRGSTFDNSANLPADYISDVRTRYENTRLGRQELMGEMLDDVEGALWTHDMIDRTRKQALPVEFRRIVVAVDPSGSAKQTADEAGIVVAGIGDCGCLGRVEPHAFVLEDLTGRYSPRDMGATAIAAYHKWRCDRLVAEDNFGGKIVEDLVHLLDRRVSYRAVHASRGKLIRAEPVAALYEQGRVHHIGLHRQMEDEMTQYSPLVSKQSPGRLDAMVWAITDLMLGASNASLGNAVFKGPQFTFNPSTGADDWDSD